MKPVYINGIQTTYNVNEQGEIFNRLGNPIKITKRGTVQLVINGINRTYMAGRIIAEAFLEKDENDSLVSHKDGDLTNNCVSNLEWVTTKEMALKTWEKRRANHTTGAGAKKESKTKRKNIVGQESVDFVLTENEKQVFIDGIATNYAISTDGKLRNLKTNKYLSGTMINTYQIFNLKVQNKQKNIMAHRLIALMFLPNPENKKYVDHINGIRTDNRIENLRWADAQENALNSHENTEYSVKGTQNYSLSIEDQEGEVWKKIEGTYLSVSNLGRVKNCDQNKILKGTLRTDKYHETKTSILGPTLTHRLVWETFKGHIPEGMVINHKNGIKNDNRLENLELVTHQENMKKASEETNSWNFREVGEFDLEGNLIRKFANASVAARAINILPGSMRNTIRRNGICHNGLKYRYLDK